MDIRKPAIRSNFSPVVILEPTHPLNQDPDNYKPFTTAVQLRLNRSNPKERRYILNLIYFLFKKEYWSPFRNTGCIANLAANWDHLRPEPPRLWVPSDPF